MRIALINFSSPVHEQKRINNSLSEFINRLESEFEVGEFNPSDINDIDRKYYDLILNFIKTGGTESIYKKYFNNIPQPQYLLTTSLHNSLPAGLEILNYINSQGGKGKIFHGSLDKIISEIKLFAKIHRTSNDLKGKKIGVIGTPSDWLISSKINYEKTIDKWGISIQDIALKEVYNRYNELDREKISEIKEDFIKRSEKMVENNEDDVWEAVRVYLALKELVKKYDLDALTIRCFDLVTNLGTTGCLALSLLNNEGIVSGCEGDLPATFTMLVTHLLTGKQSFMANPFMINADDNIVKFAHCTVPTSICNSFISRSHFETGIGVGIQGFIPRGKASVLKIGGENLNKFYLKQGNIVENLTNPHACRTQIEMEFQDNVSDYFFNKPLGNHHIIIPGEYYELLNEFFNLTIE
ncbi:MAG: L-arabinose isomerase family protein [Bacillota bacterium]